MRKPERHRRDKELIRLSFTVHSLAQVEQQRREAGRIFCELIKDTADAYNLRQACAEFFNRVKKVQKAVKTSLEIQKDRVEIFRNRWDIELMALKDPVKAKKSKKGKNANTKALVNKYNELTNANRDNVLDVYMLMCSVRFVLIAFEQREREAVEPEEQAVIIEDRCNLTKRLTRLI